MHRLATSLPAGKSQCNLLGVSRLLDAAFIILFCFMPSLPNFISQNQADTSFQCHCLLHCFLYCLYRSSSVSHFFCDVQFNQHFFSFLSPLCLYHLIKVCKESQVLSLRFLFYGQISEISKACVVPLVHYV